MAGEVLQPNGDHVVEAFELHLGSLGQFGGPVSDVGVPEVLEDVGCGDEGGHRPPVEGGDGVVLEVLGVVGVVELHLAHPHPLQEVGHLVHGGSVLADKQGLSDHEVQFKHDVQHREPAELVPHDVVLAYAQPLLPQSLLHLLALLALEGLPLSVLVQHARVPVHGHPLLDSPGRAHLPSLLLPSEALDQPHLLSGHPIYLALVESLVALQVLPGSHQYQPCELLVVEVLGSAQVDHRNRG